MTLHKSHPRFKRPARAAPLAGVLAINLTVVRLFHAVTASVSLVIAPIFIVMNRARIRLKRRSPPPPGAANLPLWASRCGGVAAGVGTPVSALWSGV